MDNLLKIIERAGTDSTRRLMNISARVGLRTMPNPPAKRDVASSCREARRQRAAAAKLRNRDEFQGSFFEASGRITRSFGRVIRARCLNISALLHGVARWRGIAVREADKRQSRLATVFDRVLATDASEKQISRAPAARARRSIASRRQRTAASTRRRSTSSWWRRHCTGSIWTVFMRKRGRVLKPNGVLAASAYNLLQIEPVIDEVVNRYYYEVVGPFWPPEREAR